MIDLHVHTTYSDGSDSVKEIFENAQRTNLSAIAITDHDIIASYKEAKEYSKTYNIQFVPGVEVSTSINNWEYHILGYFIDDTKKEFVEFLKKIRISRELRNVKLISLLNKLNYNITLDEVYTSANKDTNIGRPHFARLLVEKGYFESIHKAFDHLLSDGKKGFVRRETVTPCVAIKAIQENGGIAILAHPFSYKLSRANIKARIDSFVECGLNGLEIIYVTHGLEKINFLKRIAKEKNLLITGGSDYHGKFKPDIKLGIGFGNLAIPEKLLRSLEEFRK